MIKPGLAATTAGMALTRRMAERIRADHIPTSVAGTDAEVQVGGSVAAAVDFATLQASRLPLFIGVVLGLSFLLLLVVFRSVLVPLKAVVMNLLSISGAYGVVVAVFHWGWGANVLGIEPGPVKAWAPMMLLAIVFGLSMDYELFLLSRIKKDWDRTGNDETAVADGLANTARLITAAAAIMVCVFGGFVLSVSRPCPAAVRARTGRRRPARCNVRSNDPRAGDDAIARRPQLVDSRLARSDPAARVNIDGTTSTAATAVPPPASAAAGS